MWKRKRIQDSLGFVVILITWLLPALCWKLCFFLLCSRLVYWFSLIFLCPSVFSVLDEIIVLILNCTFLSVELVFGFVVKLSVVEHLWFQRWTEKLISMFRQPWKEYSNWIVFWKVQNLACYWLFVSNNTVLGHFNRKLVVCPFIGIFWICLVMLLKTTS